MASGHDPHNDDIIYIKVAANSAVPWTTEARALSMCVSVRRGHVHLHDGLCAALDQVPPSLHGGREGSTSFGSMFGSEA